MTMKKYFYLMTMAMMAVYIFGITACDKEKDEFTYTIIAKQQAKLIL